MKLPDRAFLLNLAGAVILIAGVAMALAVHRRGDSQPPDDDDAVDAHPSAPLALQDSKRLSSELEQNWGKLGNLSFSNFSGDPRQLSLAVLGISVVAGLGCFFVADRLDQ